MPRKTNGTASIDHHSTPQRSARWLLFCIARNNCSYPNCQGGGTRRGATRLARKNCVWFRVTPTPFKANDNVRQVGFDCDPSSILSCSLAQLTADQAANEHTGLAPDEIDFFTPLDATVTRLPATLPLFATGLGALGLFGWRRKRQPKALSA
jgi:hypothetical protein